MLKTVLLTLVVACLTGCNKSTPNAATAEVAAENEMKLDLRGMYPGMSKDGIEAVVGKMDCMPSAQILEGIENNITLAEKGFAQNAFSGQPSSQALSDAKQNAEKLMEFKKSGRLAVVRALFKEQYDTTCFLPTDRGQTYINRPMALEVSLKNGKVKSLALDVIGANSENVLDAMIVKYKWVDTEKNGGGQYLDRMRQGFALMQGVVDSRNNTFMLNQSPDVPNATRITMMDAQSIKAAADAMQKFHDDGTGSKNS